MGGLTRWSLDASRLTILFILFVALAGVASYVTYPRKEDPSITIRMAQVTAAYPGMAATRVEDLITRPIEERIREIPEVKRITSDSRTGNALVSVEVQDTVTDLAPVWQRLRDKMADLAPDLPDGTQGPTVNDEVGLTAVATVALWSDGFTLAEMRQVARDTRDRLYTLDGIKKIELYGVQDERVYLEASNARLARFGISPLTLVDTLRQQNIVLPGGHIDADGQNVIVEPSGDFTDVEQIREVLIPRPGGGTVPLRDLVTVTRGPVDPPRNPVYFNGRPAIVLSVSIQDGVNSVAFGDRLTAALARIQNSLPIGYVLDYATFQPDLVALAVDGAVVNVYQTLAIVLAVVMVFLGWRTGLIVGAFVPLAMLLGLVVMRLLDIELQRMSIASMIIALGLLVDNGIVVAEDIRARLSAGQKRRDAAIDAGRTLAVPLLTSSLTTILAFMPMMLAVGAAGEYTRSLSQVVIILLLGSWFLAMVVTPVLCVWFMRQPTAEDIAAAAREGRFLGGYRRLLGGVLRHRALFLAGVGLVAVAAGWGFSFVPKIFFPESERNQFLVYIDLPAGSSIKATQATVRAVTAWLDDRAANPDVTGTIAYVGGGGPRFYLTLSPIDPDPHRAFITVTTGRGGDVPAAMARVRAHLLDRHPEARAQVKAMSLGASESGLVEIRLVGPDAGALTAASARLQDGLRAMAGARDIRDDWENRVVKVTVQVDQGRARRAGVTSTEVAQSLNTYLDGMAVTDYREGDLVIPVVLRGLEAERGTLSGLADINVHTAAGTTVPLPQIASFTGEFAHGRIKRRDLERTVTVQVKHQALKAAPLFAQMEPLLAGLDLPPGHRWEVGGELEDSAEAQANLFATLPHCLALIAVLLVWQFNSFRRPAIILATIPLAFLGAVVGMLALNAPFGFMSILGLFSLAGIIINNGIVLIDRVDGLRAEGLAPDKAVVEAALARFRPILMTTLTTILGLLPLIVSHDPLFYGLAAVIAFGLLLGTALTLGLVPVLYTLLFRVKVGG
ncbi:MAG: efflux RND transporter permease subunit [Rhodobacterales bacterium]|nr:efflux RND transporter permease subunit [Rhodobacterales bacterium]